MSDPSRIPVVELDDADWAQLCSGVRRLEAAWMAGAEIRLADYVPPTGHPLRRKILVELIKVDQEHRWRRGEAKQLETYVEWHELRNADETVLELIEAECLTRALLGSSPTVEEVHLRFPDHSDRIDLAAIQAEADGDRFSPQQSNMSNEMQRRRESPRGGHRVLRSGELFGRYEIRDRLGEGGMGIVHRAYDTELCRDVALKTPHTDMGSESAMLERFVREARSAAAIHHPHVCPIYDAGCIDGAYYLTMALVDGQPLTDWMNSRVIEPREAAELIRKLARALAVVHAKGIVHRDIKPHNVMMDSAGEPQLMDFGLARRVESASVSDSEANHPAGLRQDGQTAPNEVPLPLGRSLPNTALTQRGYLSGTISFMAPERLLGRPADARSDIYSLGVLFYQLLTGQLPYQGTFDVVARKIQESEPAAPHSLCPDLDPQWEAICLKAMAKLPEDRYESATELAETLQWALAAAPQGERPSPRRSRLTWAPILATAMTLAAVMLFAKTGEGTLDAQMFQSDLEILIDGNVIKVTSVHPEIRLSVGRHELVVRRRGAPDGGVHRQKVTIRWRGSRVSTVIPVFLDSPRWMETGLAVHNVQPSPDGTILYAARSDAFGQTKREDKAWGATHILAIDVLSGKVLKTIRLEGNRRGDPRGLSLSKDGRYLFVIDYYLPCLTRIDLQNDNSQVDLPLDRAEGEVWAAGMAVAPNGETQIVQLGNDGQSEDFDNDRLAIVHIADGQFNLIEEVRLDDEPPWGQPAISADSRFAYVVTDPRKSEHATLYEISLTAPRQVVRKLPFLHGKLRNVVLCNRLQQAFASDMYKREIAVVDLNRFERDSAFPVPEGCSPRMVAIDSREKLLAVLCSEARKLFCLRAADGALLGRVDGLRPNATDAVFSPDGQYLFVAHDSPTGGVSVVDLTRRGSRLVYASNQAGESYQLFTSGAQGDNSVRLTTNHATDGCPRWSPDGKTIAFISNRDGQPRIGMVQPGRESETMFKDTDPDLKTPSGAQTIDWSPDGKEIVFVGGHFRAIRILDVASREVRTLIDRVFAPEYPDYVTCESVSWDRSDGTILMSVRKASSGYTTEIFRVDPRTRKTTRLTDTSEKDYYYSSPTVSPDGKRIAVLQQSKQSVTRSVPICLMDPDGGNIVVLSATQDKVNLQPRWSPDGKCLIYAARTDDFYQLFALDVAAGVPVGLTTERCDHVEPDMCALPSLVDMLTGTR